MSVYTYFSKHSNIFIVIYLNNTDFFNAYLYRSEKNMYLFWCVLFRKDPSNFGKRGCCFFQLVYMVIQGFLLFLSHYCRTTSAMRSDFFQFVQPWNFAILMKDVPRKASCENRKCVCKNTLKREKENLFTDLQLVVTLWTKTTRQMLHFTNVYWDTSIGSPNPFFLFMIYIIPEHSPEQSARMNIHMISCFMSLIWCSFTLPLLSYLPVVLLSNQ